jgi:hypothetical protein
LAVDAVRRTSHTEIVIETEALARLRAAASARRS